jgi:hypothetical protein
MRTVHDVIPAFIAAVLLLAGLTPRAGAQVEPIEPVWMVATREAPLRCGELSTFYKVADLKRGQVVRVDGRSTRWARVIYPASLYGFVREEHARDVEGGSLRVGDISDIKAPNQISGLSGSWRSIFLGELQPGTRLEIVGEALSKDGQMIGYRVRPPAPPAVDHPPHAFVQLATLRDATQEEIDAHLEALRPPATRGAAETDAEEGETPAGDDAGGTVDTMSDENPAQPKPIRDPAGAETGMNETGSAETDSAETGSAETGVAETGADESGAADAAAGEADPGDPEPATDDSLVEDMAIPTAEEITGSDADTDDAGRDDAEADNADSDPAAAADAADESPEASPASEAGPAAGDPEAPTVAPERRDYLLWEELEGTLTRVRRAGGQTLEDSLDELIAEYQRSLSNTQTPSVRQALTTRLDWLRLRKSARDQRLALQAALRDAQDFRADVRRERDAWRSAAGYDIVGRLVPSAIYDGRTLPRMYRIVAAGEGGLTRTIGYVRDEPGMDLEALVGDVVGVAGDARLDTALRLRVITPRRIDRFRPAQNPRP